MGCCDEESALVPVSGMTRADFAPPDVSRRSVLQGVGAVAGVLGSAAPAMAQTAPLKKVTISFCSQFLCAPPYEVARAFGYFRQQGLDAEIVYFRGGNAAIQALVSGAVDYGASSLDVAMQAYAKGADIRRFVTTGRLPLFALATAPKTADTIQELKQLEGKTVGVSALGNADHALLLFLLKQAGADQSKVRFATLGVNILEALRQGQVDAGLVQEPALTLLSRAGSRVLVNAMDSADAQKHLGGAYEFMGVSVRTKEMEARRTEMQALARGLDDALKAMPKMPPNQMIKAFPRELFAGSDVKQFEDVLARYKGSLYPDSVKIDLPAAKRVADTLKTAGLVPANADVSGLHDTTVVGG
jgi:NitT/TauT family transport system substrate-binding protein